MPITKRGSRRRTSPWEPFKAGFLSNSCFNRSGMTGTTMRAFMAKPSGRRKRPAISNPTGGFFSIVSSTSQVSSSRSTSRRITPAMSCRRSIRQTEKRAWRITSSTIASSEPGTNRAVPGVTVERMRAARSGQVGGKILHERQFVLVFEHHRLALRHADPLGPVQQDVRGDVAKDSVVMFIADLAQATVAGQDLGPGHRSQPWLRIGGWRVAIAITVAEGIRAGQAMVQQPNLPYRNLGSGTRAATSTSTAVAPGRRFLVQ